MMQYTCVCMCVYAYVESVGQLSSISLRAISACCQCMYVSVYSAKCSSPNERHMEQLIQTLEEIHANAHACIQAVARSCWMQAVPPNYACIEKIKQTEQEGFFTMKAISVMTTHARKPGCMRHSCVVGFNCIYIQSKHVFCQRIGVN
jgi:hypothetical protein